MHCEPSVPVAPTQTHRVQLEGHAEHAQARGLRDDREQLPEGRSGPLWVALLKPHMDPVKVKSFKAPARDAPVQWLASAPASV